jgi:hypothetical protein
VGHIKLLLAIRGLAFGLTIQTTFTTALGTVPRDRVARASAFVSATRFSVQAVAVAILSALVGGVAGKTYTVQGFATAYGVTFVFTLLACALAFRLPGWPGAWQGRDGMMAR